MTHSGRVTRSDRQHDGSSEKRHCFFKSKGAKLCGSRIWSRCLPGTISWKFSGHIQLVSDRGVDPKDAGEIIYIIWLGNALESPRRSWKIFQSEKSGLPYLSCCHPTKPKIRCTLWMADWMDECYSLLISSNTTCWLCKGCIPKDWKGLLVTGLWPARGQPSQHDSYQIDSLIRLTFWEFWNTDGIKNGWCLCSLPQILLDS